MRQAARARERGDFEKRKSVRKPQTKLSLGWLAGWLIILEYSKHSTWESQNVVILPYFIKADKKRLQLIFCIKGRLKTLQSGFQTASVLPAP